MTICKRVLQTLNTGAISEFSKSMDPDKARENENVLAPY